MPTRTSRAAVHPASSTKKRWSPVASTEPAGVEMRYSQRVRCRCTLVIEPVRCTSGCSSQHATAVPADSVSIGDGPRVVHTGVPGGKQGSVSVSLASIMRLAVSLISFRRVSSLETCLARVSSTFSWETFRSKANMATAADLVERRFDRPVPDQLWVTDITEHPTREGKVSCCVVLDVFSHRVVGWAIDGHQATPLVTNALGMASHHRNPLPDQTVIHGDHGLQSTSWAFTQRAKDAGLLPSMGTIGDADDNAVIEPFWAPHADRIAGSPAMEHPHRARQRDP
jgi:Integrase core domain